jgi:hypothetical protein
MYIRKKGKYYYVVEFKNGKQKVILYLGTIENIISVFKGKVPKKDPHKSPQKPVSI